MSSLKAYFLWFPGVIPLPKFMGGGEGGQGILKEKTTVARGTQCPFLARHR